jgi:hypothetical protein
MDRLPLEKISGGTMNRFQQATPQPQAQPREPAYSDRQFLHTYLAGALLPFLQASITAIMVGVLTVIVLYKLRAIDIIEPTLIIMALSWAGTWLFLQRRWLTLTALERALQIDLNKDGHIGQALQKKETTVWIRDVTDQGHLSSNRVALPIDEDDLIFFADGVINRGRPISRREWTPKANGFSDDEYSEFQSALLKYPIIQPWGSGFDMTRPGRALMKHYSSLSPTPLVDGPKN